MPKRIQRRRTAGWQMPPGAIYVGRPTRWGNPYLLGPYSRREAVEAFRTSHLAQHPDLVEDARRELVGHDLVCWCSLDDPCHADVLLAIANCEAAA